MVYYDDLCYGCHCNYFVYAGQGDLFERLWLMFLYGRKIDDGRRIYKRIPMFGIDIFYKGDTGRNMYRDPFADPIILGQEEWKK